MTAEELSSGGEIADIVRQCLEEGKTVEIDGLGTFRPTSGRGFRFWPRNLPKVFLAYVVEDTRAVDRLYRDLTEGGFDPWMDRRKLMPGQNWPRSIEEAIDTSDFFIAFFSANSVSKKGGFQAEIRHALESARRVPLGEIFIIPVRLDDCRVPTQIRNELQYIDLFPEWKAGLGRLLSVMEQQAHKQPGGHRALAPPPPPPPPVKPRRRTPHWRLGLDRLLNVVEQQAHKRRLGHRAPAPPPPPDPPPA